MNTVIIVQARRGSTRLPGKILMPVAGRPLLSAMLGRVLGSSCASKVVVATTAESEDDAIVAICNEMDVPVFRGHPTDLLDRHVQAARVHRADLVVKIPSDCPLIDPGVIDRVLSFATAHRGDYDYVSNLHPPSYPDGNDVEVVPIAALETAWREAQLPFEREHTTPFFWEHPERFSLANVSWETGKNLSMSHRWTIDYPEDYRFVKTVYEELSSDGATVFSINDILHLLDQRPDIHAINSRYAGMNWYRNHLGELKTISADDTRIEAHNADQQV